MNIRVVLTLLFLGCAGFLWVDEMFGTTTYDDKMIVYRVYETRGMARSGGLLARARGRTVRKKRMAEVRRHGSFRSLTGLNERNAADLIMEVEVPDNANIYEGQRLTEAELRDLMGRSLAGRLFDFTTKPR